MRLIDLFCAGLGVVFALVLIIFGGLAFLLAALGVAFFAAFAWLAFQLILTGARGGEVCGGVIAGTIDLDACHMGARE